MKIYTGKQSGNMVYDRNTLLVAKNSLITGVGPHAAIARDTYVVPAGRRAQFTTMNLLGRVVTAAAPVSQWGLFIAFTLAAGGQQGVQECESFIVNAVGAEMRKDAALNIFLAPGDKIEVKTVDLSTGGTREYEWAVDFVEFDV